MSAAKGTRRGGGRQVSPSSRRLASCTLAATLCLLVLPSMARAVDVLFVGDSLTAGYYATTEGQSFRALTSAWFALHGYPASTTLAVPDGKIAGAAGETAQISAAGADVAVIELGTNDASGYPTWKPTPAQEFEADYRSVLEAVRSARPEAHLMLVGVWKEKADRDIYDGIIARLATEYGGCFVNLESVSDDPSLSGPAGTTTYNGTSDTFHPNDAGHTAIAAAVEQAFSWQGGIVLDADAAATRHSLVNVSATPTDQFTDITQMRLTSDLSAWPDWQPFTSPSAVTLSAGDGQRTVYGQFKNQLGSLLPVVDDTIILDTRGPVAHAPRAVSTRRGRWTRLPLRVDDALSTTATIWVRIVNADKQTVLVLGPFTVPANRQKRIGFKCHLRPGSYRFNVRARDQAGNRQTKTGRNSLTVR